MNIQEILKDITIKLQVIKPSNKSVLLFEQFTNSDFKIQCIDYFIQIARNPKPQFQGLAVEALIVDKEKLYDLVIGNDNAEINIIWTKDINKVAVNLIPLISKINVDNQEIEKKDYITQLLITYNATMTLFYNTNIDRISQLFKLATIITNLK